MRAAERSTIQQTGTTSALSLRCIVRTLRLFSYPFHRMIGRIGRRDIEAFAWLFVQGERRASKAQVVEP